MPHWAGWIAVAVVCGIAEMLTPSFFIGWFGVGAVAAAPVAALGAGMPWQIAVFVVVSATLVASTKKLSTKWFKPDKMQKTNVDAVLGARAIVTKAIPEGGFGQVRVGAEPWTATSDDRLPVPEGARVTVIRVVGVHLVVRASDMLE